MPCDGSSELGSEVVIIMAVLSFASESLSLSVALMLSVIHTVNR